MLRRIKTLNLPEPQKKFLMEYVDYFQSSKAPFTAYDIHVINFKVESLHLVVRDEIHLFEYVIENATDPALLDLVAAAADLGLHDLATLIMAIYARSVSSIPANELIAELSMSK